MKNLKKKIPSSYAIIFSLIVLLAVVSWIVPGVNPAKLSDIIGAPTEGFIQAVSIVFFILVMGGYLKLIDQSGALERGIANIVKKTNGKEIYLIPIVMFCISLGGTVFGMAEETIPLYPLVMATMLACGFDTMTGLATILCGMFSGVSGSTVNPFSLGVATGLLQEGTDISLNQGIIIGSGVFVWLSSFLISSFFVMRYAKKVKADKANSVLSKEEWAVAEETFLNDDLLSNNNEFTNKMRNTLLIFGFSFIVMVLSVLPWDNYNISFFEGWTTLLTGKSFGNWGLSDLSTWFLLMSVIVAIYNKLSEKDAIKIFMKGSSELVGVAMIVGLSKGVSVILTATALDEQILSASSTLLDGLPPTLFAILAYLIYTFLTILIPSTSGLASVSIPTLGTLTHSLGFSPEVLISIYIGSHFIVGLAPTAGTVMSGITISKVEYTKWLRFFTPIYLTISVVNIVYYAILMTVLA